MISCVTEVMGFWQRTPISKLAPSFSSLRLLLCLLLSLAFCSWPGGSLQHLKVHGQPDSLAGGSEHWEPRKCKAQQSRSWAGGRNKAVSPCQNKSVISYLLSKESKTVSLCRNKAIFPCQNSSHLTCSVWQPCEMLSVLKSQRIISAQFCLVELLMYGFILVLWGFLPHYYHLLSERKQSIQVNKYCLHLPVDLLEPS